MERERACIRCTGEVDGWTVSRRDVAHFIVDAVTNRWEEYGGRQVSIAY